MTILYIAVIYFVGIVFGRFFFETGWLGCWLSPSLWLYPFVLLPITPLLNHIHLPTQKKMPLRWPEEAGFIRPRHGPSPALIAACALTLVTGGLRYAAQPLTPCWSAKDLASYNLPASRAYDRTAPEVTLTGYVSSYPLQEDVKQQFQVTVHALAQEGKQRSVVGEVRLTTGNRTIYRYGQPLQLRGRLVTPPDFTDFSYREYLARKGVHSLFYPTSIEVLPLPTQGNWLYQQLYRLRAQGEQLLNRLLPEPYAALANGMLLGIESGIPDELYEQFNLTGSSHVIVISGSNVALIAGIMLAIGHRLLGRQRALWPTLLGVAAYALLVGGDAAVLRAAWMGALYTVATTLERRSTALVSLAFACWVMTLANPLTLWDVGFQLSSAATAGLILFSPGVVAFFQRLTPGWLTGGPLTGTLVVGGLDLMATSRTFLQGIVQDGLMVTIAANLSTLPLVLYYFGRLSFISLMTNLLIAPVQPLIMLWGSAGLLVGLVGLSTIAQLILWIPWLSLVWTVTVVQWTASLPGASVALSGYGWRQLCATYGVIALAVLHRPLRQVIEKIRQQAFSRRPQAPRTQQQFRPHLGLFGRAINHPVTIGLLTVSTILLWLMVRSQPDGRLHLYFLNIGQGDGILIQTPSGRQVLIDGGASPQQLRAELGAVMPFWDRTLDLVIMTHPDSDHMRAQSTLPDRMAIDVALETAASSVNPDADEWRANMLSGGATVAQQAADNWIDLGDGVALWFLWPPPVPYAGDDADNENSFVAKVVYGDLSVLLTGDAGLPSEAAMVHANAPLQANVLKIGHHGSKSSTGQAFLAAVQPQVTVIQVGVQNDYGHPHAEVLDRLVGTTILRNDLHGRIHMMSDGHLLWFDTETDQAPPSSALAMP
ncbi:MAG: ComEC/Rec2 family competence protein [Caldilineaceae bacterium]|nr:ComEC/Rec2 family competence protein [Caldilineaceae bacterium]